MRLNENTRGAAETINIALNHINLLDCPIICLDGDNFYKTDIIKWDGKNIVFTVDDKNESVYSILKIKEIR